MEEDGRITIIIKQENGRATGVDVSTNLPYDDMVMFWLIEALQKVRDKSHQNVGETN